MDQDTQVNTSKTKSMEMVHLYIQMAQDMKVCAYLFV